MVGLLTRTPKWGRLQPPTKTQRGGFIADLRSIGTAEEAPHVIHSGAGEKWRRDATQLESRMLGNSHVRFGGSLLVISYETWLATQLFGAIYCIILLRSGWVEKFIKIILIYSFLIFYLAPRKLKPWVTLRLRGRISLNSFRMGYLYFYLLASRLYQKLKGVFI